MKNKKSGTIDAVETWRPWCIFTYTIEEKGGDLSKIGYIKVNKDTKCCSWTNDKIERNTSQSFFNLSPEHAVNAQSIYVSFISLKSAKDTMD